MNNKQIKALGLEGWDADKIEMFEMLTEFLEWHFKMFETGCNFDCNDHGNLDCDKCIHSKFAYYRLKLKAMTGKTFEEIQEIMEGRE